MEPVTLIIFGITSNLAQIKLVPALYDMEEKGALPKRVSIVGIARKPLSKDEFKKYIWDVLNAENKHHKHPIKKDVFEKLTQKLFYINGHAEDITFYPQLKEYLNSLNKDRKKDNRIYYLATYPDLYKSVFKNLQKNNMNKQKNGWVRLMIEKPIGNNLTSAKELNQLLLKYFDDNQVYRLDHYLGKETLQNILTFRFGNDIFEPLIDKDHIDHIQITAAEDFGIGKRGSYYDLVGALKDVGQNHQLQMLAFATMDAPTEFTNQAVTSQRIKILKSLTPLTKKVVFGQYEGYQNEESVSPESQTDTFYALKTSIDSPRYKGVPVYIRAGKKLTQTVTEIAIVFKNPQNRLFKNLDCGDEPNVLIYRIQPNEGIVLKIVTKKPGLEPKLEPAYMQYCYRYNPRAHYIPDPYERLILDTIKGDQTFFNSAEEVEAQWAFTDPLVKAKKQIAIYKPGTWGPKEADELIEADGRQWLEPSMDFCRI